VRTDLVLLRCSPFPHNADDHDYKKPHQRHLQRDTLHEIRELVASDTKSLPNVMHVRHAEVICRHANDDSTRQEDSQHYVPSDNVRYQDFAEELRNSQ
jgi:hypothetical protein